MMLKKITFLFAICTHVAFATPTLTACAPALLPNAPDFCRSFKKVAQCYCAATGLPQGMCNNMSLIYSRMLGTFGTIERACAFQHNTSAQVCMDSWNCYRNGGATSQRELCSTTGKACE